MSRIRNRARSQIGGTVFNGFNGFFNGMCGNSYYHIVADSFANTGGLHIVLAYVNSLGVTFDGNIYIVVDDKRYTVVLAYLMYFNRFLKKFLIGKLFSRS